MFINLKTKILNLKKILGKEEGFGIVELLIATLVFSIITIVVSTNFVNILDLQRRGFASQTIQEETLFAIESMAREIRVSQIQGSNVCGLTSLTITHPINGLTTYSVNGGMITKSVDGNDLEITSSKVDFSGLTFCLRGVGIDNTQARVTIIAPVQISSGPNDLQFDIQTTISSRDISEELL